MSPHLTSPRLLVNAIECKFNLSPTQLSQLMEFPEYLLGQKHICCWDSLFPPFCTLFDYFFSAHSLSCYCFFILYCFLFHKHTSQYITAVFIGILSYFTKHKCNVWLVQTTCLFVDNAALCFQPNKAQLVRFLLMFPTYIRISLIPFQLQTFDISLLFVSLVNLFNDAFLTFSPFFSFYSKSICILMILSTVFIFSFSISFENSFFS